MTELGHDLAARAREAVAAAEAPSREQGWTLVHLAGALRDHARYDEALELLDLVASRCEDPDIVRAAFTCAVTIHMDRDATGLANALCDEQRRRGAVDLRFLRAEIRARKAWLDETGEEAADAALRWAQMEVSLISGDPISAS